jgi:CubicO group peptidase (beta-lactamase class C family)
MRIVPGFLMAGVLTSTLATAQAPQIDFAPQLEAIRAKYGLPSLSVAAILKDQTIGVAAVGVRQIGKPETVTLSDAYQLGSVSKGMNALMIARLVERKILHWDITLGEALPQIAMLPEYKTVTLEMLLTHRSGLVENVEAQTGSLAQARKTYLEDALKMPRGKQEFLYSNVGFVAAAMIAETATGKNWEELIQQEVFTPLEMQGCGFGFGTTSDPAPHYWEQDKAMLLPYDTANPKVLEGADQIRCPLTAVAKYVSAHLTNSSYLSKDTWDYLHHDPFGNEYAFGWVLGTRPWARGIVLTHSGSNTVNYAVIWIAPKRGIAAIVATNIGVDDTDSLERTVMAADSTVGMAFQELFKLAP